MKPAKSIKSFLYTTSKIVKTALAIVFIGISLDAYAADATPPVITPTVTGVMGNDGWYISNVNVNWTVVDPESAITAQTGCNAIVLVDDSAGSTYTCTATSAGGTSTQSVTVKKDSSAPVIKWAIPFPNDGYYVGDNVLANFSCSDVTSGLLNSTCTGTFNNGTPIDTSTVGLQNFSVTATDKAGNVQTFSRTYTTNAPGTPIITTYAGGGLKETALALQTPVIAPYGVAVDKAGNKYYSAANQVFKIDPSGMVKLVAGNGSVGFGGDDGPAIQASLAYPAGITTDTSGNLYIADTANQRVRKVDPTGNITTLVGSGVGGLLSNPSGVATDAAGNLYIADKGNNCIRKVDTTGFISTVAGNGSPGFSGDGGLATLANLYSPVDISIDATGNLYIADLGNNRIRKVDTAGFISTVAGNGIHAFIGDGGPATEASLDTFYSIAVDASGNLYISDYYNPRIRKVDAAGIINTVVGGNYLPSYGYSGDGDLAALASISHPSGVATDAAGNLYIADTGNNRILMVNDMTGIISTLAGNGTAGYSGDGGLATQAGFSNPLGTATDATGNLYIADTYNNRIHKVDNVGKITTVAGNGVAGFGGDGGPATQAELNTPYGVATDAVGNLYIADSNNNRIRKIDTAGNISTVAGSGGTGYQGDGGDATQTSLYYPFGITLDSTGNLYIADYGNNRVRKVDATGSISTVAGNGFQGVSGDGGLATQAPLGNPYGVTLDATGNLYITDYTNNLIRKVDTAGIISTMAGNGSAGFSGDGGVATQSAMNYPSGVVADAAGNIYVADSINNRIRRVDSGGNISTVVGNGLASYGGDGDSAILAGLNLPYGIFIDATGNLYIADQGNNRIRIVKGLAVPADTTPPIINPNIVGTSGSNGWYTSNVVVSWSVTDAESAVTAQNGCGTTTVSIDTAGTTFTCTATSKGGTATQSVTIQRDVVKPSTTITAPANGASYILGSTLAANYSCSDSLSGIASCTGTVANGSNIDTSTLGSKSFTVNATDLAGTVMTSLVSYTVTAPSVSDVTPPVITPTVTGTLGNNGWYVSNINVSWNVVDLESAISSQTGCVTTVLVDDSAGTIYTCFATSAGGTSAQSVTVKKDASAPAIKWAIPSPNDGYYVGDNVLANFSCTDALSGLETTTCTGTLNDTAVINSGSPIGTSTLGIQTLVLRATDLAGNVQSFTRTYTINALGTPIITTYAGGGQNDSVPALQTPVVSPNGIAVDKSGNKYYSAANQVFKLDPSGMARLVAGNGTAGFSGDGGAATAASLAYSFGVTIDVAGNLYIADDVNNRIRKVDALSGNISTVAGNGTPSFSGDGGAATAASLNYPAGVAVDAAGNLYIADTGNNRIRKVDGVSGIISTVAGNDTSGFSGDGGAATQANLSVPYGVSIDAFGNLYIADTANQRVRKIDAATGFISTVAGSGNHGLIGDGGPATQASLSFPNSVATDKAGNLYIADWLNYRIRKVDTTGTITTVAGDPAAQTMLSAPFGIAIDAAGNLFFAEPDYNRIRKVDVAGALSTVAGSATPNFAGDGGTATAASLNNSDGVVVDAAGNLYIADSSNQRIRKVDIAGNISTVAGNGTAEFSGDSGPATAASLYSPAGVTFDVAGNLYIADQGNNRIRKVDVTGNISTVAGNGTAEFSGDSGPATAASLYSPAGITFDAAGNLYIADAVNNRIRKVDTSGIISTVAGNGITGFSGDGGAATAASLSTPFGVTVDAAGNLYIADYGNSRIRKVDTSGIISTVAGNGMTGFSGDGSAATATSLDLPLGVTVDAAGNLYIADYGNSRIRKVDTSGIISTVAGNGSYGFSGDGGTASSASLNSPFGVTIDAAGNLYIADTGNHRIRMVTGLAVPADTTPPIINPNIVGTMGANGWYTSNVVVSWSVTDAESAITAQNGCTTSTVSTDTAGTTFTCSATSKGGTATQSVTIQRDVAKPSATITAPANGASYILGSTLAANYSCSDSLSGIASCTGTVANGSNIDTSTLGSKSFTVNATDLAGNVTAVTQTYTVTPVPDVTPPIITPTVTGTMGTNGWYVGNVTVSWSVTDPESVISSSTGCSNATITSDTAGTTFTCTANSTGGTNAKTVTIKRDTSNPTAAIITPANGSTYNLGTAVVANYTCSDALSGVATCTGSVVNGANIDTSTAGNKTFSVNSVDVAGNSSTTTVSYIVAAATVLSPTSLTFGAQAVGTNSPTQAVTVYNGGTTGLRIGTISVTTNFSRTSTCPGTLAAKASCTINVAFAPRAAGNLTGTLTVGTLGAVALSGVAVTPTATLTPTTYAYGNTQVGSTSSSQNFTYTNTSVVAITVRRVALGGANPSNFNILTNGCAAMTLQAGASCNVDVVFKPSAVNARNATLSVTDTAGGAPVASATLSGLGVAASATLTGNTQFGSLAVGVASAPQTYVYTNTGIGPINITSVALGGTNPSDFAVISDACKGTLLATASSCAIQVTFTPAAIGRRSATLTVDDGAGGVPVSRVTLRGTGI